MLREFFCKKESDERTLLKLCFFTHMQLCDYNDTDYCYCRNYKSYPAVLSESGNDISNKRASSDCDSVRYLSRNVIDVVTLRTGRRHDSRIGDRRAMVSADCTCETSRDTDYEERA